MARLLLAASACALLAGLAAAARAPQQKETQPRYVVLLDLGPKWEEGKSIRQQTGFSEHAERVNRLALQGSLLVGGPLLESRTRPTFTGALFLVAAESEDDARKLVAEDALVRAEILKIASVRVFIAGAGAWIPSEKPATPEDR
jgi:uncharacterized protein YciI